MINRQQRNQYLTMRLLTLSGHFVRYSIRFLGLFTIVLVILVARAFAKAEVDCIAPQFKALNMELEKAIKGYDAHLKEGQTADYAIFKAVKYSSVKDFLLTMPKNYGKLYDNYTANFEKLDQMYQGLNSKTPKETRSMITKAWKFHLYMLIDVIPVLINERFFSPTRTLTQDVDLEKQAKPYWKKLAKEFSSQRVKLCLEQETQGEGTSFSDYEAKKEPKPYKLSYKDVAFIDWTIRADYPNLVLTEEPGGEVFSSKPAEEKIKGKGSFWTAVRSLFGGIGDEKVVSGDKPNKIQSENIPLAIDFLAASQLKKEVRQRHLQWRNNRNFWLQKTRYVSGYNLDKAVDRFEAMLDIILKQNYQLDLSLDSVAYICANQRTNLGCWNGGNVIPNHPDTIPEKYEKRLADS